MNIEERRQARVVQAWYVARTKPGREKRVQLLISEKWGIEVFLPMIRCPSMRKAVMEPLFPNYLFCRFGDRADVWPDIRWVPGLCYFLGAGPDLTPVSEGLIVHLKQRVSWWNEVGFEPCFTSGESVMVTGGPFAGLEGIFQKYMPARQRCQVLLQIIGQESQVELPVEDLAGRSRYSGLVLAV